MESTHAFAWYGAVAVCVLLLAHGLAGQQTARGIGPAFLRVQLDEYLVSAAASALWVYLASDKVR